jgi:hypothetical protein
LLIADLFSGFFQLCPRLAFEIGYQFGAPRQQRLSFPAPILVTHCVLTEQRKRDR